MEVGCILRGGLGNQLFMVAATVAHGLRHGRAPRFLAAERYGDRPAYWTTMFRNISHWAVPALPAPSAAHTEPSFNHTEIPAAADALVGYFQSEKYFKDHWGSICRQLGVAGLQRELLARLGAAWAGAGPRVSLHIRIGDYAAQADRHPVLAPEYYRRALAELAARVPGAATVYYFYERPDRAAAQLRVDPLREAHPTYRFVSAPDTWALADWEELLLMSCCDHHIVANSSFSWWGAYFNSSPDQVVCRPSVLTGPALPLDTADYSPPEWTRIEVA